MGDEYYDRLGVPGDATSEQIATAYRERLKEIHPDVSDASNARERTRRLIEAKEVLTDERERAHYDRLGHTRYVRLRWGERDETDEATHQGVTDEATAHRNSAGNGTESSNGSRERWKRTADSVWNEVAQNSRASQGDTTSTTAGVTAGNAGAKSRRNRATESVGATTSSNARWVNWSHTSTSTGTTHVSQTTSERDSTGEPWQTWNTATSTPHDERRWLPDVTLASPQAFFLFWLFFITYPLLLVAVTFPLFTGPVRLLFSLFLVGIVLILIGIPQLGLGVFGSWLILFPLLLLSSGASLTQASSLIVMGILGIPFGLSAVSFFVGRAPPT